MKKLEFDVSTIPARIRYARIRKGWTQTRLATEIKGCPTHPSPVCRWERGFETPSDFPRLASILGVRVDWLMLGTGNVEA